MIWWKDFSNIRIFREIRLKVGAVLQREIAGGGSRKVTIPDAGADSDVLLTAGDQTLAEGKDLALGTTTGSKIGTAVGQKLGFWGATPVVQQASASQAAATSTTTTTSTTTALTTDLDDVRRLVNRLRADLVTTGVIKGSA